MADLYICTETFTGETPTGAVTFFEGVSTLDGSKDAALLKGWAKYFKPLEKFGLSTKDLKPEASK
jgi:hypothetical protein